MAQDPMAQDPMAQDPMAQDPMAQGPTSIYVASPEGETGKSTIALGILHRLAALVPRVGVFRPITRREDRDYILAEVAQLKGGIGAVTATVCASLREWLAAEGRAALARMPREERATSALQNQLGRLLQAQGKLDEAAVLIREALEAGRATLGDCHPHTLISISNLGRLLHDQGRLGVWRRGSEKSPGLRKSIEGPALVEELGLRTVQVLGPGLRIHGAAAEGDNPSPPLHDGKQDPVPEPVVGCAAVLRGDQQARLHKFGRTGTLGDEVVLQPGPAGRSEAQAKARPFRRRQSPALEIGAGGGALGSGEHPAEPLGGQVHPVGKPLPLLLVLGRAGIGRWQGQARLRRQPLHGFDKGKTLAFLKEGDQVTGLSGREVEELPLVVIDLEGRRLLLGEGRQADIFTALTLELHRPPDDVGRPKAGLQFFKEAIVEAHLRLIARKRRVWVA
jgi:hypothetical protein